MKVVPMFGKRLLIEECSRNCATRIHQLESERIVCANQLTCTFRDLVRIPGEQIDLERCRA